jgi:hypothetical protein
MQKGKNMTSKQKLNTREAAAYLSLRPNTLEIWRCHHIGPRYSKLGSRVVYDRDDLEAFFTSKTVETLESSRKDQANRSGQ